MDLKAIVAYTNTFRVIGHNGRMLWNFPADLRRFRQLTEGDVVIMGRQTWESLSGPLSNRINVVLSRRPRPQGLDSSIIWAASPKVAIAGSATGKNVWVIGGQQIYECLYPHFSEVYATVIDDRWSPIMGDVKFPLLAGDWQRVESQRAGHLGHCNQQLPAWYEIWQRN